MSELRKNYNSPKIFFLHDLSLYNRKKQWWLWKTSSLYTCFYSNNNFVKCKSQRLNWTAEMMEDWKQLHRMQMFFLELIDSKPFNGFTGFFPYLHLKVAKSLCCASVRTQGAAEDSRLNIIHHNCCRLFFTHKPVSVIKSWCGRGKTVWSAHQTVLHTEKKKPEGERDRERARGLFLSQEKHTPDHNYVFEASLWPLPPHPEPGAQCFQCVTRQSSMQLLHTYTHIPVSNHSYTQIYTFIHTHTF